MKDLEKTLKPVRFKQAESNETEINIAAIITDKSLKIADITKIVDSMIESDEKFETNAVSGFKNELNNAFDMITKTIEGMTKTIQTVPVKSLLQLSSFDLVKWQDLTENITTSSKKAMRRIKHMTKRLSAIVNIIETKTLDYSFTHRCFEMNDLYNEMCRKINAYINKLNTKKD